MKVSLLSVVMTMVAATAAAKQPTKPALGPAAANAFKPTSWSLTEAVPALSRPKIDISPSNDDPDELTVYGKRIRHEANPAAKANELTLGPATLKGTTQTDLPGFRGMTITASVPVPGIAGLDAVLNVSGGHDQVNTSTTATSAAAVVGLKMNF